MPHRQGHIPSGQGRMPSGQGRMPSGQGHIHEIRGHIHQNPGHIHEIRGHIHQNPGHIHEIRGHIHQNRGKPRPAPRHARAEGPSSRLLARAALFSPFITPSSSKPSLLSMKGAPRTWRSPALRATAHRQGVRRASGPGNRTAAPSSRDGSSWSPESREQVAGRAAPSRAHAAKRVEPGSVRSCSWSST